MTERRFNRTRLVVDYTVLAAAWALTRVPFLHAFDLVSYDGTYYITQAAAILAGNPGTGGAFPPGYPLAITAMLALIGDGVRAAQAVSMAASLVATIALYLLARGILPRLPALLCAAVFTTTPLIARLSLTTMSESLYLAWLLLGLLAYGRRHRTTSALALGAAAITRPEALAVAAAVIAYDALHEHRYRFTTMTLPFLAVYSLAVLFPVLGGGPPALVPKLGQLGQGAVDWRVLESGGRSGGGAGTLAIHYLSRLPGDITMLFQHTAVLAVIAAAVGITRHRGFVALALIPLVITPAFTLRPEPRFVAPYIPVVVLYAFVAATWTPSARSRWTMTAALVAAALLGGWFNRGQVTVPESAGFEPARVAGMELRNRITPGSSMADRKPFLAFYAGARYVEVPPGRYDVTLDTLAAGGIDYLALMTGVTDFFRPDLAPLLYDPGAVRGETRLRQIYADALGIAVYAVVRSAPRATVSVVYEPPAHLRVGSPRWSGDGERLVFTGNGRSASALCSINVHGGRAAARADTLAVLVGRVISVAPSPDGRRVAFVTARAGSPDIQLLDVDSGRRSVLVRSNARDLDPAWDGDNAVVFASEIGRHFNLYRVGVGGDASAERIAASGRPRRPRPSRDRGVLAWTTDGTIRLGAPDGSDERRGAMLRNVTSAPSWSPDGRYLVVSARESGSDDIYIVDVSSKRSVRVTSDATTDESEPDWHPVSNRIVFVIDQHQLAVLEDLEPYLERLRGDYRPRTYEKAAGRRPGGW